MLAAISCDRMEREPSVAHEAVTPDYSLPIWREASAGLEWLALRASPVFRGRGVPGGDGSAVVIVPGFVARDDDYREMAGWLDRLGYHSYPSAIGRNTRCPDQLMPALLSTIELGQQETGRAVHLIGHSLGGAFARVAASERPSHVRQVISLGSPVRPTRVHPFVLAAGRMARRKYLAGADASTPACYRMRTCNCAFATRALAAERLAVPRVAIYTRSDGIVDWRSCIDAAAVNIVVSGSHTGLAVNAAVYRAIAMALSGVLSRQDAVHAA
jgi:triacylglycerol lipase